MFDIAARAALGQRNGQLVATVIIEIPGAQLLLPAAISAVLRVALEAAEVRAEAMVLEAAANPLAIQPTAGNA